MCILTVQFNYIGQTLVIPFSSTRGTMQSCIQHTRCLVICMTFNTYMWQGLLWCPVMVAYVCAYIRTWVTAPEVNSIVYVESWQCVMCCHITPVATPVWAVHCAHISRPYRGCIDTEPWWRYQDSKSLCSTKYFAMKPCSVLVYQNSNLIYICSSGYKYKSAPQLTCLATCTAAESLVLL